MRAVVGTLVAVGLALALTLVVSWPAVTAPAERIYGAEIVGRHHDPFTVMRQMAGPGVAGPYHQPATDATGRLLARVLHPVVAYNVLVLASFPLTAAATYALSRYLLVPHLAALFAALAFTFAPVRLAHAAYHPHILQTMWLPVYFLALFAMIDRPSWGRAAGLALACGGLALSNFYAGLMGAVLTPVAMAVYAVATNEARPMRRLGLTAATVAGLAAAALAIVAIVHPVLWSDPSRFAVPVSDVADFSARWWAYGVPPVTHAVFGAASAQVFAQAGVTVGLVEQQVFLGYGLLALALAGATLGESRRTAIGLLVLAALAAAVSMGPGPAGCASVPWAPACLIHTVAPMFRSYARFALVAHLMVAVAAGMGIAALVRQGRRGQALAVALVAATLFEYWPMPARTRDVLPTEGHRWLMREASVRRALDCTPHGLADADVPWLMEGRLSPGEASIPSCRDPWLGPRLAALGYSHLLVRRPDHAGALPLLDHPRAGLRPVADFPSARVYAVVSPTPKVVVLGTDGFHDYEYAEGDVWRWMTREGRWQVRNTTTVSAHVALALDLQSFHEPRLVDVFLDDERAGTLTVPARRSRHVLGPWRLGPGAHTLVFRARGASSRPDALGVSADTRELTIAFHDVAFTAELDDAGGADTGRTQW